MPDYGADIKIARGVDRQTAEVIRSTEHLRECVNRVLSDARPEVVGDLLAAVERRTDAAHGDIRQTGIDVVSSIRPWADYVRTYVPDRSAEESP